MKQINIFTFSQLVLSAGIFFSCQTDELNYDASGAFEATEIIVPAQVQGVINDFEIEEGTQVRAGTVVGFIDSTQLFLKKKQLEAQIESMLRRRPEVKVQLATLESKLNTARKEKMRIENLVKEDAATTKQLDDIEANVEILEKQIAAQKSSLTISSDGITLDANALSFQIRQLEDQLEKSKIVVPMDGTILQKYSEQFEMAQPGKPLFKIADLSNIFLRAYVTGSQLSTIKLEDKVEVQIDNPEGEYSSIEGIISWISSEAEFTPKSIQTKEERVNKVYAIKIKVPNDGTIKIGMYGQVIF